MTGGWAPAEGWGVVDRPDEAPRGGRLYAAALDSGVIRVIEGPAAVVCRAALAGRAVSDIRDALADRLEVATTDVDVVAVQALLAELVELGVLTPYPTGDRQSPASRPSA